MLVHATSTRGRLGGRHVWKTGSWQGGEKSLVLFTSLLVLIIAVEVERYPARRRKTPSTERWHEVDRCVGRQRMEDASRIYGRWDDERVCDRVRHFFKPPIRMLARCLLRSAIVEQPVHSRRLRSQFLSDWLHFPSTSISLTLRCLSLTVVLGWVCNGWRTQRAVGNVAPEYRTRRLTSMTRPDDRGDGLAEVGLVGHDGDRRHGCRKAAEVDRRRTAHNDSSFDWTRGETWRPVWKTKTETKLLKLSPKTKIIANNIHEQLVGTTTKKQQVSGIM